MDDFDRLPTTTRQAIDDAFDAVVQSESAPKHAPGGFVVNEPGGFLVDEPGGFIVDEPSDPAPGGFVLDEPPAAAPKPTYIPLSQIPSALALLDLPPDDDQVLSVFRNAASGWTGSTSQGAGEGQGEGMITRKDWRSVCAVLLASSTSLSEDEDEEPIDVDTIQRDGEGEESDLTPDDGEYEDEDGEEGGYEDEDGSEDEYVQPGPSNKRNAPPNRSSKTRKVKSRTQQRDSDSDSDSPKTLTSKQLETTLQTFALFFPSLPPPSTNSRSKKGKHKAREGEEQSIEDKFLGVEDIARAASLLKEKISVDESDFITPRVGWRGATGGSGGRGTTALGTCAYIQLP
ncbi:hypothetical protein JAAARDRAFT_77395 [Jaapia argillacea MUCL 33604]|uniref:Uncharacterized protein n=1 Tax=Jaapia argillacea MUCL 33604 TaxID=933084 RepID=A0A067PZU6_9AGAM|nr:hypothetical protein JAAARDRAFT_77395 [Jaapia argillacea MUCL 33604]